MPVRYWVPLMGLRDPAALEHLHAVVSRWLDRDDVIGGEAKAHNAPVKPYSMSPCTRRNGVWGVEVGTLTDRAADALVEGAVTAGTVRLGGVVTEVGEPQALTRATWMDLAQGSNARRWRMDLLSPTLFRSTVRAPDGKRRDERVSPLPTVPVVLRAPSAAWERYGPSPAISVSVEEHAQVWVSDVDLETETVVLNGRRYAGAVGSVEYRCSDPGVGGRVDSLFALAPFSGVGSFTGKGFGVVEVARL